MSEMDPNLKRFISRIIDHAINSAIHTIFWRMPLVVVVVMLAGLIAAAVYWKLY